MMALGSWHLWQHKSHLMNFMKHFCGESVGRPRSERFNTGTFCGHRTLPLGNEKTVPNLDLLTDISGNQRLALNAL